MKTTQEASSSFNSVFASVSNLFFANENKNYTKLHDLAKGDLVMASHADSDSSAEEQLKELLNTDLKNKINLQDEKGNTPLHYAVTHGNNLCAELLLKHGARLDIANADDNTPADVAELQQNIDFDNTIEDKLKKTKEVIERHQETTKENIYTLSNSNDENHDSDGYVPMEPKSNDGSRVCSFLPTW